MKKNNTKNSLLSSLLIYCSSTPETKKLNTDKEQYVYKDI